MDAATIGEMFAGPFECTVCGVPKDRRGLERRSLSRLATDHHFGRDEPEGSVWAQSGAGGMGLSGSPPVGPQSLSTR